MSTTTHAAPDRPTASPAQVAVLFFLRIAIGWHFLYEGIAKLYTPGWTSREFLETSRWIVSPAYHWIAEHPAVLRAVDFLNIGGLLLIGLALMLGVLARIAGWAGMLLILLYWTANPPLVGLDFGAPAEGHYLVVDKNLVEFFALAALVFFNAGRYFSLEARLRSWFGRRPASKPAGSNKPVSTETPPGQFPPSGRREILKSLASLPFLGAFAVALARKRAWESYEEKNLVEAVTSASVKTLNLANLGQLKGRLPLAEIRGRNFSRLILGGNLLSGWAHSRDLMYVSQLVKAYHHKDKIFATLLVAEKCGVNTLLTNPILSTIIGEYWKRGIGRIQFISDCAGLNYDAQGRPSAMPYGEYLDKIQKAIDRGACACYIQGETADYYMGQGNVDAVSKALDLIRRQNVIVGIGAHKISTLQACVDAGLETDFWMKTYHASNYWSYRHPEWNDNAFCLDAEETAAFMKKRPEPWIAFKVMAAGAILPKDGFRFAFEGGADIVCAGMYDFQMVDDVNLALEVLSGNPKRDRGWMG
jgi:uncharacterized membrane protein YphA (DoxX/SURF4 family)